jgi:tripartite-type tricarboxylate transporter receptor subunit TctC
MMRTLFAVLALAGALAFPAASSAQSWPERPVRFIVPYPPGGNADLVGRVVAQALEQKLHQTFIIENKSGGGGVIAGQAVANSPPDGYTYFFTANGPILFAPELVKERPYSWNKDFETVATVSFTPLIVLINQKSPINSFKEFIEHAQAAGGKTNFASAGMGSSNHLLGEYMEKQLNLKWTTVQYRGTAPAMNDLIGGHADFSIDQVNSASPFIKSGAVRALAVSSEHRWPALPDVPTMTELGYPKFVASTFTVVMAPAQTPKAVIAKLNASLAEVVRDPAVSQRIEALGSEINVLSPEKSAAFLAEESAKWTPVVRELAARQ